jgi:hypothetical protein
MYTAIRTIHTVIGSVSDDLEVVSRIARVKDPARILGSAIGSMMQYPHMKEICSTVFKFNPLFMRKTVQRQIYNIPGFFTSKSAFTSCKFIR